METAVLQCDTLFSLALNSGVYLIRRGAKDETDEHNIFIDDESVDGKHALIIVEADEIFVYDLNTRFGTFVNEKRLPVLTRYSIQPDNVCIRFGKITCKLNKCSTLERNHSSGFHEESIHLALETTVNDAGNLTIPETQFVGTPNSSSIKDSSYNNTSIPETQEVLAVQKTVTKKQTVTSSVTKDAEESQFQISTQDFNDGWNEAGGSNSREFLENLEWLIDDLQPTSKKQNETNTNIVNSSSDECGKNQNLETRNESKGMDEDITADEEELRSQLLTPDLFNGGFLNEFEKKETNISSTLSNQNQKTNLTVQDASASSSRDANSEERTRTASEKTSNLEQPEIMEENISEAKTISPDHNITVKQSIAAGNSKLSTHKEIDIFEGEALENPEEGGVSNVTPLQDSNKENMLVDDLKPTQVFVSKKAKLEDLKSETKDAKQYSDSLDNMPKEMLTPKVPKVTSVPTISITASDSEPTQLQVPKKNKDANSNKLLTTSEKTTLPQDDNDFEPTQVYMPKKNKSRGTAKSRIATEKTVPADEKDLEPTQIYVPKKTSKKTETEAVRLNSTMVQDEQKQSVKRGIRSFFADQENEIDQDEQPSCSKNVVKRKSSDLDAQIMLTPEFIANPFDMQKPPDSASRRQLFSRIESDSDDDTLRDLLTYSGQVRCDFNGLISNLKQTEAINSEKLEDFKESDDLLSKYITKKIDSDPEPLNVEKKLIQTENNNDSKVPQASQRTLRNKRNTTEEANHDGKSLTSSDKITLQSKSQNLKRKAAFDDLELNDSKKRTKEKSDKASLKSTIEIKDKSKRRGRSRNVDQAAHIASNAIAIDSSPSEKGGTKQEPKRATRSSKLSTVSNISKRSDNTEPSVSTAIQKNDHKISSGKDNPLKHKRSESFDILNIPDSNESRRGSNSKKQMRSSGERKAVKSQRDESDDQVKDIKSRLRTRVKPPVVRTTSKGQEINTDELDVTPSTSQRARKGTNTSTDKKTTEKSVLKLAFTMIDPQIKEKLLEHSNHKWMEVQDSTECEVLVMDTANRTVKFLIALAKGIPIVTSKWIEAIRATGIISVRPKYFFKDTAFEKSFKFSILHTLNQAKKAKLFVNFKFLLTKNIVPPPDSIKMIITCAGGTILEEENMHKKEPHQNLYLVTSETDRQHWRMYRRSYSNICITSTEAVMLAIMRYDQGRLQRF